MQLTLIPEKDINEFFLSKHFVLQEFESVFAPEMSEDYHGFSITPEYPNGGMTAISVMHLASKRWWSIPTDCHKFNPELPNFDYSEEDKAFEWVKSLIDEYLGIIPNAKIDFEGNGGGDYYLNLQIVNDGLIKVAVGHCCVKTIDAVLPVEVLTAIISNWLVEGANGSIEQGIRNV